MQKQSPSTPDDIMLRELLGTYCRERDEAAFRAFYDACKHAVLRIAVHLAGRGEHAYDLSQEIWMKLWKHLCGFRGESKLMSWVYRVAMTTYLDKKSKNTNIHEELSTLQETSNDGALEADSVAPPERHNPEVSLEGASAHELIERALEKLTPSERTVFVAKHFHDLTFKEISTELGTHEGTAKTLHFRALKKLQTILMSHEAELRGTPPQKHMSAKEAGL
jgi:RNA polymerase sigma-70 factor (ECF subfamily)